MNIIEPIFCVFRVKSTALGYDNLPVWFFQKCSVELAEIRLYGTLLGISLASG